MCEKEDRMHVARIMAADGHSQKDIAEKLGVSDRMVRKYLKPGFGTRPRTARKSILEPFHAFLDELLEEDPFINLIPVYERLQRRGYRGGMTILRDYARSVRKRVTTRAVRRFETEPGLQAQVDWKECGRWNINGQMRKLYAFVMILGFSRKPFVLFTTNMKLHTVLKAHLLAFAWYGAVPREILYDNMKTAWSYNGGHWRVNSSLLSLASACGFTPRRCRVRRPQTKGKVERFIGYLAHNFLPRQVRDAATTIGDLNDAVARWLSEVDDRQIGGFRATRRERFAEELPHMLPWVREATPDIRMTKELVVSREATVRFESNRYSVPAVLIGETVTLKVDTLSGTADIVHEGAVVRSLMLLAPGARLADIRAIDERDLLARWQREQRPGTAGRAIACEQTAAAVNALIATPVQIRHPSHYERLTERTA